MTEFQRKILEYVCKQRNASTWEIAQNVFPEKWARLSGRGALIGHIDRAASSMSELIRLPPRDEHGEAEFWYRDTARAGQKEGTP